MDSATILREMEKEDGQRIFLMFGRESFLIEETVQTIRSELLRDDVRAFNESILDGKGMDLEDVLQFARTPPVMDDYRVTVVEDAPYFKGEKKEKTGSRDFSSNPLERFALERVPFSCLIFRTDEVDQRRTLYKSVIRYGRAHEYVPLRGRDLFTWIDERIRRVGKTMSRDAMQVFVDMVGSDLRLLTQEIAKLAAYAGQQTAIGRADVMAVSSRTLDNNVFNLVDSVGRKDRNAAIRQLTDMLTMNEPPVRILFMLIRQIRLIYDCQRLAAEGANATVIAGYLDTHPYSVQKAMEHLPRFTRDELKKNLQRLLNADEDMKSGRGDPRLILETVIMQMSA
jgi:DNA polymerase-3 subunit delta